MNWKVATLSQLNYLEIHSLFKLRTDIFVVEQQCPYPEIDQEDLTCKHGLLIDDQHQVWACFRIIEYQDYYKIGRVAIHQKKRGSGLAYQLMNQAIEQCPKGVTIRISAQAHLKAYYAKCGFKVISDIYLEDGIPHLEMEYHEFNY